MKCTRFKALLGVFFVAMTVSACSPLQLARFESQTGIELGDDDKSSLLSFPDYSPGNCLWVETGLRARGFNEAAVQKAVFYARRESDCCPLRTGGDNVDQSCQPTGKNKAQRFDPSDTGFMQFNGFLPGGGVKPGSPAVTFCAEGVRRFRDEVWTDEITRPCNQWEVTADPELQVDMLYLKVLVCGYGPWEPVNGRYPCKSSYNPLV